MPLDALVQRPDIASLLYDALDNHHLLLLSMCCRAFRDSVDAAQARLGRGLFVGNWAREALNVKEYADCIVLHVDCSLSPAASLAHKLSQSLTGKPGEVLCMGVQVYGIHTDETFTQSLPMVRFRNWQLDFTDLHCSLHPRYGRYTLRMRNIDAMSQKDVVMYIQNIELPLKLQSRRTLLALRQRYKCMACNVRAYTYTCASALDPRLRKVCKRCASELLVSMRMLVREWKVGSGHAGLASLEGRYRGTTGTHAATWVSKADAAAFFGAASWPDFIARTAQRMNR